MSLVSRAALSGLGFAPAGSHRPARARRGPPEAGPRAPELDAGHLKPVLERHATAGQGVFAIYPGNRHLSTNVRAFLDLVVEMTGQAASWRLDGERWLPACRSERRSTSNDFKQMARNPAPSATWSKRTAKSFRHARPCRSSPRHCRRRILWARSDRLKSDGSFKVGIPTGVVRAARQRKALGVEVSRDEHGIGQIIQDARVLADRSPRHCRRRILWARSDR